jgi:ABC-type branched-subunit amino acid transport system ATPase component/ABC-type branched-subunit amino acid transport system permease subunit
VTMKRLDVLKTGQSSLTPFAVLVVAVVVVLIWVEGNVYDSTVVVQTISYILLAQGFNIVGGFGGRLAFGNIVFFGLGALAVIGGVVNGWYPAIVGLVIAVGLSALLAYLLTMAFWKLAGLMFALVTFALASMLQELTSLGTIFGGPEGLQENISYTPSITALNLTSTFDWAIVGTVLVVITTVITWLLARSGEGRQLMATRDDLAAAAASGINCRRISARAWALSAVITAVAGVFYVQANGSIDSTTGFGLSTGNAMLTAVIIGGIGSVFGPLIGGALVGAALFLNLIGAGGSLPGLNQMVYGVVLILAVRTVPGGVTGLWAAARTRISRRRAGRATAAETGAPGTRLATVTELTPDSLLPARQVAAGTDVPVLTLRGVQKRFGGLTAVDGVDLELFPAEIVGLVGPNGAGKSTLFSCIHGAERISAGEISFDGQRIDELRTFARARLGIGRTFQTTRLFKTMTALDNIAMPFMGAGSAPAEARAKASEVGAALGLAALLDDRVAGLSQVDQRRVELARGVAAGRRLVLLDEVMTGLAEDEAEAIGHLITGLRDQFGTTVLIVEHVMGRIAPIADRIVVMDFGRVIASGPPADVFRDVTVQTAYLGVLGKEAV